MPCGSESLVELMKEIMLPAISKTVFDRAPSVRKQFVIMLATWFQSIVEIRQFQASLFPLLLAGVVDESPEVHEVSLKKLEELSVTWEARENDANGDAEPMAVDTDNSSSSAAGVPPAYFPTRPPAATRKLAARYVIMVGCVLAGTVFRLTHIDSFVRVVFRPMYSQCC